MMVSSLVFKYRLTIDEINKIGKSIWLRFDDEINLSVKSISIFVYTHPFPLYENHLQIPFYLNFLDLGYNMPSKGKQAVVRSKTRWNFAR